MKTKLTQKKIKAVKHRACGLCKPWKRGWEDKKTFRDLRNAAKHEYELKALSQQANRE